MVLPADRARRHGRLARSCASRENWKALGHSARFRRNFKRAPKTGASPKTALPRRLFIFSDETGALAPACGFDLQRGNAAVQIVGILFAQSISSAR